MQWRQFTSFLEGGGGQNCYDVIKKNLRRHAKCSVSAPTFEVNSCILKGTKAWYACTYLKWINKNNKIYIILEILRGRWSSPSIGATADMASLNRSPVRIFGMGVF